MYHGDFVHAMEGKGKCGAGSGGGAAPGRDCCGGAELVVSPRAEFVACFVFPACIPPSRGSGDESRPSSRGGVGGMGVAHWALARKQHTHTCVCGHGLSWLDPVPRPLCTDVPFLALASGGADAACREASVAASLTPDRFPCVSRDQVRGGAAGNPSPHSACRCFPLPPPPPIQPRPFASYLSAAKDATPGCRLNSSVVLNPPCPKPPRFACDLGG